MKHDFRLTDTAPVFARIRLNPKQQVLKYLWVNVLAFLIYLFADILWQSMIMILFMLALAIALTPDKADAFFTAEPMREVVLLLYLTAASIALTFLYCCAVEKRPVRTLGITKQHGLRDYLAGTVIGTGMMAAVILLIQAGGGASFCGVTKNPPVHYMLLFFFGWLIQGFSEELAFRGFLMMSAGTYSKPLGAVILSSVIFAAAHLGNSGISLFAVCNLTLFGVLTALIFLRTDSIWCTAALHSFWNMAQSNIFGMKVSGIDISAAVLQYEPAKGMTWLNGGAFGPEGGAATTIVLAAGILLAFLMPQRTVQLPAEPAASGYEKGESV